MRSGVRSVGRHAPHVWRGWNFRSGRWSCSNCSLFNILTYAYEIWEYKIVSPDWLRTTHFDIVAKVPVGATRQDFRLMQQNLLQERFKMAVHHENKETPVYDLVVGKGGSKLMEVEAPAPPVPSGPALDKDGFPNIPGGTGMRLLSDRGRIQFRAQNMDNLAHYLSGLVDRPVLDATGLKGKYAFTLSWYLRDTDAGLTIYEALPAQLGLKLEPKKGSIENLVIDHCERIPVEN